ncbi:Ethylene receptor [Heracleum sosnowskyi]|uniref:histidine kinase n=1 Tax=Heracleum sosnowskyi TaxID=360622 RepID=A0AAD8GTK3_9APIA|nr:Ethylene receptor [Heracleum sosnowskyi]
MQTCDCIEPQWHNEVLMQYQNLSDIMIAFAYFFIALELLYFSTRSKISSYTRVLMLFGAFILLCGATHFLNLWTASNHSINVAKMMAVTKLSTAIVSCVTALMLVEIIPDFLSLKRHEVILKRKAEELDTEKCLIIREEESARNVRMLTRDIRSTLDKRTILETTLTELGRILDLAECALWMPSQRTLSMELTHSLNSLLCFGYCVPIHVPIVSEIFNSAEAIRIPHTCPLAKIRYDVRTDYPPQIVAVRVPLLKHSNFEFYDGPELVTECYAIMVLILPLNGLRRWHRHELELVEVAADQVAVALSHAEILEDSMRASNQIMEQNLALESARKEAEIEIQAYTDFITVMCHEMMTPMHAVIILSSLLLETELTPDQRFLMVTIQKNCNLLSVLIDDVLDISRLYDGSIELDTSIFSVHDMFVEGMNLVKPIASAKKLSVDLNLDKDLPVSAIGDRKCLMHVFLHIIGNAIKFTKEGRISVEASIATPEYLELCRTPGFSPMQSDSYFYLLVQVTDSGQGITSEDLLRVFTKFLEYQRESPHDRGHPGLGLAICKRFVKLMGGHIWIRSDGLGKGTTVTFIVRLGVCESSMEETVQRG